MDETILSWNVTNWVTVILMAGIGIALLGLLTKAVTSARGNSDATA